MDGMVLIFDEVATNRIMLKARFAEAGYVPMVATSIADCLRLAVLEQPDGIVLGANCLSDDFTKAIRALKSDPKTRDIPVIVIDGKADTAVRLKVLELGADDVLSGPSQDKLLMARLRNLLRNRQAFAGLTDSGSDMMFGLNESKEEFQHPTSVMVVSDKAETASVMREALSKQLDARVSALPMSGFLNNPDQAGFGADIYLIDSVGQNRDLAQRLLAELRCRATSCHAGICLIADPEGFAQASIALDLGADDVVTTAMEMAEITARLRLIQLRKQRADEARGRVKDGLRLAMIDPLTGLYNRRYAMTFLNDLVTSSRISGQPYAVLLADLDRFKLINDRYGHAVGDAVLIEVARRLVSGLRREDLVSRIGGEEFLIVLPDQTPDRAETIARDLCHKIEADPVAKLGAQDVFLTASFGLAVCQPGEDITFSAGRLLGFSAIERADQALLRSKRAGRNHVTVS